jgi:hypothetical protein
MEGDAQTLRGDPEVLHLYLGGKTKPAGQGGAGQIAGQAV